MADTTNPLSAAGSAMTSQQSSMPQTSTESSLSNWAGPYVTEMLGKGQALANAPYQAYTGQLTAGPSALQSQAFQGLAGLTVPTDVTQAAGKAGQIGQQMQGLNYGPAQFTAGTFDTQAAQQYMNPYLQMSLNPQLEEARRQADIQRVQQAGRLTKAGAYGGSRQAIMESELARNLGQNLAGITGQGYNNAYQQAMSQFNADQARQQQAQQQTEQSRQFGAGYGLQGLQAALGATQAQAGLGQQAQQAGLANIAAQLGAGAQQRGITSEGLAADKAQFEQERDFPYKQVQYQQSLLQGLPLATQSYGYAQPSTLTQILNSAGGVRSLYDALFGSGAQTTKSAGTT